MAIAWILRLKGVTSALIGASRPEQIVELAGIGNHLNFTGEELERIEQVLEKDGSTLSEIHIDYQMKQEY